MFKTKNIAQLDPIDQKGASPYAYCANNPLKFIDPTGMSSVDARYGYRHSSGSALPAGKGNERIPFNFSADQWSWIDQNISKLNIELPRGQDCFMQNPGS